MQKRDSKDLWKSCTPMTTESTPKWSRGMIPNQSCWLLGFTEPGNQYTKDSRSDKRDTIPDGTRASGAYRNNSGSNEHSPKIMIVHGRRVQEFSQRKKLRWKNGSGFNSFCSFLFSGIFTIKNFRNNKNGATLRSRWTRSWWSCSSEHNLRASGEGTRWKNWTTMYAKKIGCFAFRKAATKKRFEHCLKSRSELKIRANWWITCEIRNNWKEFIFHRGSAFNQFAVCTDWAQERQTVFFRPLDPFKGCRVEPRRRGEKNEKFGPPTDQGPTLRQHVGLKRH